MYASRVETVIMCLSNTIIDTCFVFRYW